jgi:hypothetical protein
MVKAPASTSTPTPTTQPSGPTAGYWKDATTLTEFYVTADQTKVRRFQILVNLEGCGSYYIRRTIPAGDATISNNQFSFTGSFYASGTFDSSTVAHGTTGLNSYGPICGSYWTSPGAWSWNTTWQNSSQPDMPAYAVGTESVEPASATGNAYEAVPVK